MLKLGETQEPIPATWYNEDYYNGVTSNYANGYTWEGMGQLFVQAARLLGWMFPEATRFLDFGAAKGYLVRALREEGKEAWGVEHSPYCLEVAEAVAKPYMVPSLDALRLTTRPGLARGGLLTDVAPQRSFDVVTAFETFEHLTESQIAEVLPALQLLTGHVLFCTMPVTDVSQPRWARELAEKDISHVTIRSRAFWYDQFETAGFVHNAWHALAERFVHTHPLVQQAGWAVFILSV